MILSKKQYYNRRWFLTILFLIAGLWLISVSIGIFSYNKDIGDLMSSNTVPEILEIERSKEGDYKYVILTMNNKNYSSVIKKEETNTLIDVLKDSSIKIESDNIMLTKNILNILDFKYLYWKDKLYELSINNHTIIPFKKRNNKIAYIVLTIGILWSGFQGWALYTLYKKGIKVYDESFKKKEK